MTEKLDQFALARIPSVTMALMDGPCTIFDLCTVGKFLDHRFSCDCAIVDDGRALVWVSGLRKTMNLRDCCGMSVGILKILKTASHTISAEEVGPAGGMWEKMLSALLTHVDQFQLLKLYNGVWFR